MNDFAHLPATIRVGDFEVCRLGFGAMQLPGPHVWGEPKDPERARRVLRLVIEQGVQLIDTSWYYGPYVSNRLIAETLHPYPRDLVLATKLGGRRTPDKAWAPALRPEELRAGCEDDLRGLKLERVDVCHLRAIQGADTPFDESLGAMIELVEEGKIRHLALSNVTLAQLEYALGRTPIVAVSNLYNVAAGEKKLAGRIPFAVTSDQEAIVDLCAARGIAYLPFCPLSIMGMRSEAPALEAVAKRRGVTPAQIAIAWLLARSPAMLPIPGTGSPEHQEENWAAHAIALAEEDVRAIDAAR